MTKQPPFEELLPAELLRRYRAFEKDAKRLARAAIREEMRASYLRIAEKWRELAEAVEQGGGYTAK